MKGYDKRKYPSCGEITYKWNVTKSFWDLEKSYIKCYNKGRVFEMWDQKSKVIIKEEFLRCCEIIYEWI